MSAELHTNIPYCQRETLGFSLIGQLCCKGNQKILVLSKCLKRKSPCETSTGSYWPLVLHKPNKCSSLSEEEITCTELSAEHNTRLHTLDVTLITNRVSRADWNMDSIGNAFTEFYDASEVWFGATETFQIGSEHSGHRMPGYGQECTCVVSGNIYFIWNIQALQKGWFVILIDWGTQLTPSYCHLQLGSCFCRYKSRAQDPSISRRLETHASCHSSYQIKGLRGCRSPLQQQHWDSQKRGAKSTCPGLPILPKPDTGIPLTSIRLPQMR